jgi:hypothetical protein
MKNLVAAAVNLLFIQIGDIKVKPSLSSSSLGLREFSVV